MKHRLSVAATLVVCLLGLTLAQPRADAYATRMEQYLVGAWQQSWGPYVTQTVLKPDFTFVSTTVQRNASYRLYVEGVWSVRGNDDQLWTEWKRWEPSYLRKPLPEGTMIQVIDQNRYRNKLGVVYRMQ